MTLFALPQLSVLSIRGKDRQTWLNNLCTQNLKSQAPDSCVETFLTNVKGKTIAHGWILILPEHLLFVGVPQQVEFLLSHFDRYIFREDVVLEQQDSQWRWFGADDLSELPDQNVRSADDGSQPPLRSVGTGRVIASEDRLLIEGGMLGSSCWMIGARSESMTAASLQAIADRSGESAFEGWQVKRIEAGVPYFGIDFDEQNLPQELDRDAWAISFHKGCYLGQETVARLDALGQVQKKLFRLALESPTDRSIESLLAAKSLVHGDQVVGTCTSLVRTADGRSLIGLAMIKRSHFSTRESITLAGLPVTSLPIPQPDATS